MRRSRVVLEDSGWVRLHVYSNVLCRVADGERRSRPLKERDLLGAGSSPGQTLAEA